MKSIPTHQLLDKTDKGFIIFPFTQEQIDSQRSELMGAHRDDHYIFFILLKGSASTVVDFEEKIIHANQLYYILPEQIHYRIQSSDASGWYIAVDPSLIETTCRNTFERWLGFPDPVDLISNDVRDYHELLTILHRRAINPSADSQNLKVLYALLHSFFEMAAATVQTSKDFEGNISRAAEISFEFKKYLNKHIRRYKSPSDYAGMLHISEPYLNESLNKYTGSSVSFWIRYKIIMEAKQLLYFSHMNVKQIANDLGFENHSYFSRFFAKETGMTALEFRKSFRNSNPVLSYSIK
ncbi:helix-turn-helix domain-containing protein [Chryseobacterium paridis]|uniref:AraC family transcriptional regulator n=1 Tax=Chryseobacterium paridis TaxID=2800328 RepID=A0ABS1FUJ3_9FLAO|nr:helix-turn-helix transcriptional regulator [Chryseobacterium paridis]MBK1896084.1 AraC family transcriptional regulator [Chryseobacterium paridis]